MTHPHSSDLYVCPKCHSILLPHPEGVVCNQCGVKFPRHPAGYLDLRPDDEIYQDLTSHGDADKERFLKEVMPTEMQGAKHMMMNYLLPLLSRLKIEKNSRVLSVGCGGGWDVEVLHQAGYQAWGIDNGGRTFVWGDRSYVDFLSLANAIESPFPDKSFDFVFSEGVIEHIGFIGDSPDRFHDWENKRKRFIEEQWRVTKAGGYILVACPNRSFPVDFFHGGKHSYQIGGLHLRFHSPSEDFLLSMQEIKKLIQKDIEWIKPLTLSKFFNTSRLAQEGGTKEIIFSFVEHLFDLLPSSFWGSVLSPYLVVLIKKR